MSDKDKPENLWETHKKNHYDKLHLENDGFDEDEIKKEYPKEFEELLKEFDIQ